MLTVRLQKLRRHVFTGCFSEGRLLEAIAYLHFPTAFDARSELTESTRQADDSNIARVGSTEGDGAWPKALCLAAEDEIVMLEHGQPGTSLDAFLAEQGAVSAQRSAKLYRGR